jgi:2-oxo-4-hydroxy-4-carboxy--5-ureidoimidazoline (OHCU) decarboxylase
MSNDRATELRTAAEEQAKITRLRLAKLVEET